MRENHHHRTPEIIKFDHFLIDPYLILQFVYQVCLSELP